MMEGDDEAPARSSSFASSSSTSEECAVCIAIITTDVDMDMDTPRAVTRPSTSPGRGKRTAPNAEPLLSDATDKFFDQYVITTLPDRKRRGARQRKSTTKVRSGCITCKKRKVKCDETKPECLNCRRLKGTKCEGYDAPKAWMFESKAGGEQQESHGGGVAAAANAEAVAVDSGSDSSTSPPPPPPPPPPPAPAAAADDYYDHHHPELDVARKAFYELRTISTSFGTNDESRSFAYYMNVVGPIMTKRSGEPYFWGTILTRAAWQHDSVKYGLIAVSQIDEANGLARRAASTEGSSFVPSVSATDIRQKALQSYSAAVRAVMSEPRAEIETVLLTCACLFAFENFIGNLRNATKHIEGAMGLVENWKKQQMQSGKWKSGNNDNAVMVKHIVPMIEAGAAYHRISVKAGRTAAKVMDPKLLLKDGQVDWSRTTTSSTCTDCI